MMLRMRMSGMAFSQLTVRTYFSMQTVLKSLPRQLSNLGSGGCSGRRFLVMLYMRFLCQVSAPICFLAPTWQAHASPELPWQWEVPPTPSGRPRPARRLVCNLRKEGAFFARIVVPSAFASLLRSYLFFFLFFIVCFFLFGVLCSRMRSQGSFRLGVVAWRCVRWTLCLCSQPSEAVRNRPRPSA